MKRALGVALALATSAAPAFAAVDWSHAQPVTVIATEYKFLPNHLSFRDGVAYRLHVENRGKEMHWFHAPAFFKASLVRNADALDRDQTEIQVAPGEGKDLYLVPQRRGQYKLYCPDHDWAGMTGSITVK